MTPLLLLVDLQRDYLANPGLEPAAGPLVERAARLLEACRRCGVPVAHAWTTVSRRDDRRMPHWRREGRWLCEDGTPGHAPPPELEPRAGEAVVHKTAYSAFEDGDLDRALSAGGIDLLVVAGVHLHACVRQAVLDAYQRGVAEIWVAEDATASDDPVHAAITRRYLERAARFLSVAEVSALLRERVGDRAQGGAGVEGEPGAGLGQPGEGGEDVVRVAAARCRAALPAWRHTDPGARARLLERLADRLDSEASLAEAMASGIGKPVGYGAVEVRRAGEMLRAVARRAAAAHNGSAATEVRRRPLGVVATVTPWNNPIYIPLGKIAPALMFGNAVAWKPAPPALSVSERLAALIEGAGLPPGTLGVISGGRRAAQALMADPDIDAVSLTGSSPTGFAAQEICARRRIPLQAELGGNNAALVWEDADLEHAAREIAEGAFGLAGQRCTANRRVIVHRARGPELLELLERLTAALSWGDPRRADTRVGPLVSAGERDRVAGLVSRAAGAGEPIVVPHGDRAPTVDGFEGRWYPPTIVPCEDPSHEIVQEESFGPVLVVQAADHWEQAMALVNGVRQGLVAALFSSSPEPAARFLDEAEAGILKLNRSTADADVDVPFGGWKSSGVGPPEHGGFDRDFYTRPQVVYR